MMTSQGKELLMHILSSSQNSMCGRASSGKELLMHILSSSQYSVCARSALAHRAASSTVMASNSKPIPWPSHNLMHMPSSCCCERIRCQDPEGGNAFLASSSDGHHCKKPRSSSA